MNDDAIECIDALLIVMEALRETLEELKEELSE